MSDSDESNFDSSNIHDERVDLNKLIQTLERCIQRSNTVDLENYLEGYRFLYRFFRQLGTVFVLVAAEIASKLDVLESRQMSDEVNIYKTVDSLVTYEKKNNLLKGNENGPSGARLLLPLHRAVLFILKLLEGLSTLKDSDLTADVARKAYYDTISKFHKEPIRTGVYCAMWLLPTMKNLVKRTCVQSPREFRQKIPIIVKLCQEIYKRTQNVYLRNECLNLA